LFGKVKHVIDIAEGDFAGVVHADRAELAKDRAHEEICAGTTRTRLPGSVIHNRDKHEGK
jgi:hypothetical protein